jgi:hypothetical protein
MKQYIIYCLVLLTAIVFGCEQKSQYQKLVDRELAKNVRYDSLFLGYHFGMTKKEFFMYSWELNKQKKVKHGSTNQTVQYDLDGLPGNASMNFYPDFKDGKIYQMSANVSYEAWAPWNKELFADSLKYDLVNLLEQRYGNGFIKVDNPQKGISFVKVDGNRKITLYKESDQRVAVIFTDLTAAPNSDDK